jgi:hypothetical protein
VRQCRLSDSRPPPTHRPPRCLLYVYPHGRVSLCMSRHAQCPHTVYSVGCPRAERRVWTENLEGASQRSVASSESGFDSCARRQGQRGGLEGYQFRLLEHFVVPPGSRAHTRSLSAPCDTRKTTPPRSALTLFPIWLRERLEYGETAYLRVREHDPHASAARGARGAFVGATSARNGAAARSSSRHGRRPRATSRGFVSEPDSSHRLALLPSKGCVQASHVTRPGL